MNNRIKISTSEFLTSFSGSKLKKLDKLQKSVSSINKEYSDSSFNWYKHNQVFSFSEKELHSAIKRVEKNENNYNHFFADVDFDKVVDHRSLYSNHFPYNKESFVVSLFKAIFGFVVPSVHFDDHYTYYETPRVWTEIYMSEDLETEVLAELYYRRATRILSNILSKFFEFRKLITAESPIKKITYKYFDLLFSLKKEVALNTMLIKRFFNQLFYCRENEKIYFGNIQAPCRT
jgi:hypothetical protein